ncbi:AraC family transcriptional regulator [Leptospira wolffii]|uniref:AraC family transcriptional regulator n=1 Tax=Leptospira wolffii TaxID=409998 RepID=A0A2M9Z7S9_9LEPT|nr:AraC family transcriptional regulator [Leptospira wolffii]EPG66433.1 AraC-type transcriptional regulator N-terminal domain protein [Leptospira wolffii serovar Khorat str. Khorat-H2]PJZ64382.1 AraC family transcriptional regulator [Leptospira wolffii]
MEDIIREIAELTIHAGTEPTETELPGVWIIKGEVPQHQLAAVYQPMIGFIVRGGKTISIGDQTLHMKAPSYFIIPTEMPASGKVEQGKNGLPYVSVALYLNQESILSLMQDLPDDQWERKSSGEFSNCDLDRDLAEAWLRMLRLLHTPEHIAALFPVYEREILYRTILGPQGWRLRQLCFASGKAPRIHQSIRWIRENFKKPLDIGRIAAKSGLAVTTFHRQFKDITGISPIQFQKQLRLLEARKLLVYSGSSVLEAAYEVGYESPSQFNREYSRFFGESPARDASRLRKLG